MVNHSSQRWAQYTLSPFFTGFWLHKKEVGLVNATDNSLVSWFSAKSIVYESNPCTTADITFADSWV